MNPRYRLTAVALLLLMMTTESRAQNSSLMRPQRFDPGYRAARAVPPPPLPQVPAGPEFRPARRIGSLAQASPAPRDAWGDRAGFTRHANPNAAPPNPYGYGGPLPDQELSDDGLSDDGFSDDGTLPAVDQGANYDPYQRMPRPLLSLNEASWTLQPTPPVRIFRKNDVVTIRVDEITRMMAEGIADQRKRTLTEAILTDWIRLDNFRLRPDPQEEGDPGVAAETNDNYRAESFLRSRESLTFNIAATVVDIRPNGNLVLEARKAVRINDNLWETSLSGICRADDIGPDNVVLSKDVIDLEIRKEDRGHLRDGYSRGWLKRFWDRYGPF
jgi:flagellar L-ring protein precursor FlgH